MNLHSAIVVPAARMVPQKDKACPNRCPRTSSWSKQRTLLRFINSTHAALDKAQDSPYEIWLCIIDGPLRA